MEDGVGFILDAGELKEGSAIQYLGFFHAFRRNATFMWRVSFGLVIMSHAVV